MPEPTLSTKQRYWLKHVRAADAGDESIVAYAAKHGLAVKPLYAWKTRLIRLGAYDPDKRANFASVTTRELISSVIVPSTESPSCRITLPSGARVEFMGDLSPAMIRSIITLAGSTQ